MYIANGQDNNKTYVISRSIRNKLASCTWLDRPIIKLQAKLVLPVDANLLNIEQRPQDGQLFINRRLEQLGLTIRVL